MDRLLAHRSHGLLRAAATPVGALRFALAVMFGFTALSHFLPVPGLT